MTTDKTIAFIRAGYKLIAEAYDVHAAYAAYQYAYGMTTMAAAHFIIDFATEEQLRVEMKEIYQNYVDTGRTHS
ncbi:hypothetical protein phiK7A1_149 [Pseudomonas phage phiK7A1]|uniref:Uncharacterized protein n=1 Tax=Pseudomonas phage phiK7A1 TaxID=2759194 RepID=A0A7H0XFZ7_9CAUD|nr:hypothetical protein phiK7A1_149 [Pseudomonas phage phiK7A1]